MPLEPRARILSEEKLEALLYLGDPEKVEEMMVRETSGIAVKRREHLYHSAKRNRQIIGEIQELYKGRCQICAWDPRNKYNDSMCQGHHIICLSRGGYDVLSNLVLVCPNHHTAIHRTDAPLDYEDFSFDFTSHKEPLQLNVHLDCAS